MTKLILATAVTCFSFTAYSQTTTNPTAAKPVSISITDSKEEQAKKEAELKEEQMNNGTQTTKPSGSGVAAIKNAAAPVLKTTAGMSDAPTTTAGQQVITPDVTTAQPVKAAPMVNSSPATGTTATPKK